MQSLLTACLIIAGLAATRPFPAHGQGTRMVTIPGGSYEPFYPEVPGEQLEIEAFRLDRYLVTNANFLAFVRRNPRWQRSRVPALFADANYLEHWRGDTDFGERSEASVPVVNVSWFAAAAYCRARGARLPSEEEWEYVALASETSPVGMRETDGVRQVLEWYSAPRRGNARVGQDASNVYGVYDLHGLVWEWVSDFNATMIRGDNRQDRDPEQDRYCGGASFGASDVVDYAAFMRFAFRASLEARYAVRNLGFRCASDLTPSAT